MPRRVGAHGCWHSLELVGRRPRVAIHIKARRIISLGSVDACLAPRGPSWGRQPATLVQVTFGVGSERVAIANVHITSGSERNDTENRRAKIPGSSPGAVVKFKREALLNVVRKCKVELAEAQALAVTNSRLQPLAIIGGDFNLLPAVVKPVVTDAMSHFNSRNFDGLTSSLAT